MDRNQLNIPGDTGTLSVFSNDGNQNVTVHIRGRDEFPKNRVNDDNQGADQDHPAIAVAPDGSYVTVWVDQRNSRRDIYAQRFNASGTKIGQIFKVNNQSWAISEGTTDKIDVAMAGNGSFVIVWDQYASEVIYDTVEKVTSRRFVYLKKSIYRKLL